MRQQITPGDVARFCQEHLANFRKQGAEWRGPCPLHGGENPSFAIDAETGQWFCHSKCGTGGSFLELKKRLGLQEEPRLISRKKDIVADYDYTDENGTLLFQCVRYAPKGFSQRRPDGRGGWINNLKGVRLVLFQLRQLLHADLVLIAEGEKDVLNLKRLGFVATCNPMGAGKWRPEFSEQLARKRVVILPDNDEPGRRHALDVAESLYGKAASVKIAPVPNGKDVSDWINSGATRSDLECVIEAAPVFESSPGLPVADWRELLIRAERGAPKPILANAITAFRNAPEWSGVLGFDEFSQAAVALRCPPWPNATCGRAWTDDEDRLAADWLQHQGILVSIEIAAQAVQTAAKDHRFHPVRDYLARLKWDGTKRLDGWLSLYLGVDPTAYSAAVGARWMISAVARIFEPGVKADSALILEGVQGLMKSTALRTLAGDFFTDDIAELGTKDSAIQTRGAWIIEIPELDAMSRVDVSKVKAFISRCTDRFRPPYGKRPIESPRQCVFAGSVNHCSYLRDETGARRFWPVSCTRILTAELARDRDQLWAEAVHRYHGGERWWLDTMELIASAVEEQSARYESDPWEELVSKYTADRPSVSIDELLDRCISKPRAQWTQADKNRIARCMTALGWERYKAGPRAGRQWRYRPMKVSAGTELGSVTHTASQFLAESGAPELYEQ